MAAVSTVVSFEGSDAASAKTQIDALNPAAGNWVISWRCGSKVFVAKIVP